MFADCGSTRTEYVPATASVAGSVPPFVPKSVEPTTTPSARFTDRTNEQQVDVPIVTFDARTVTRWPAVPVKISVAF